MWTYIDSFSYRNIIHFFIIVLVVLVSIGCDKHNQYYSDELTIQLESLFEHNSNDSIYHVFQNNFGNEEYFTLTSGSFYNKSFVDAYCFINGNLVTFCSWTGKADKTIVNIDDMIPFSDTISGYCEQGSYNMIEEKERENIIMKKKEDGGFEIVNHYDQSAIVIDSLQKTITNPVICKKLYAYMKNVLANVYYIYCYKKDGNNYLQFGASAFYDPKQTIGYFFCNGILVVVYSSNNDVGFDELSFLNMREVKKYRCRIAYYKESSQFVIPVEDEEEFEF